MIKRDGYTENWKICREIKWGYYIALYYSDIVESEKYIKCQAVKMQANRFIQ